MADWSPLDLAPGLYAAALALTLAGVLRRWYDPVPGRVLAAFAVALAVLFGGALFGGRVLLPLDNLRGEVPFRLLPPTRPHGNLLQGDLIQLVVPSLAAARRGLTAGHWPLWNPRVGAGMPLLGDPQAQALAPLAVLALPFSPVRGAAVMAALRVVLALIFTFLLLRRQGLGEGPALAGALAYGLSGVMLLWVGWPLASAAALLPAVLYALALVAGPGRRRDTLLLVLALAALLLAGHPETELYVCLLAAAFTADLVRRSPPGRRLALLRRTGGAAAVAAGLAAPALLPAVDYLPQTLRAERLAHPAPAAREETPPPDAGASGPGAAAAPAATSRAPGAGGGDLARRWLPIVAPNTYGNSRFAAYWGFSNTNEDAAGFAGTAAALAAALAVAVPRRRRLPQEGLMLAVLGVCLLQLADPGWLHALLAALAPALAGSRRCLVLVAFCLAYLAACTCERHRRGELRRVPLVAAAVALGALIAWAYLGHASLGDPHRLEVLRLGWLRWQARFLAGATLLLALPAAVGPARRRAGGALLGAATGAGLAVLVGGELLLAHLPANPPMPMRLAFPRPPPLAMLAGHLGGDRVAALGRALPPNLASLYDMTDARVYNPMAPAAYLALLAPVTAAWWGEMPELGAPGDPLYRRLGVGYLLVAPGERLPPPWTRLLADPSGWVYRRTDVWPRLYTATAAGGEPRQDELAVVGFDDDRIVARARLGPAGAVLAGSVYQDGGWRLLIGRRRAPAPPGPGGLLAAPLPRMAAGTAGTGRAVGAVSTGAAAGAVATGAAGVAVRTGGGTGAIRAGGTGATRAGGAAGATRAGGAGVVTPLDLLYRPRGFVAGMLAAALACAAVLACLAPGPPSSPPR